MQTPDLKNMQVVVVGLGLTGKSCVKFLQEHGANVIGMDRNPVEMPVGVKTLSGDFSQDVLLNADLVVLSPGVNPNGSVFQNVQKAGVEVIGDVELFARFNTTPVIAITGSNGKSTVTCLVNEMLNCAGMKAQMGGNIGTPVLDLLNTDADYLVLELSSFQLELLQSLTPVCATILNVSEDHIDRHQTFLAYTDAKQRVYRNAEYTIANRDDVKTWPKNYVTKTSFGLSHSPLGVSWDATSEMILVDGEGFISAQQCALQGLHNILNIQAAIACVMPLGVEQPAIAKAVSLFTGLAHRFEVVSEQHNVRWINDSKATNIGATIAALQSLKNRGASKLILIAGGDGKKADFTQLQPMLLDDVDLLITLGKDGREIASLKPGSIEVADLMEAVTFANGIVESGDIVLLSPACASLDMFDNYQHRGDVFKQAVLEVAQ
ncbi:MULTISPECIES: UDP-N-acetylmuramoyl-L-alanine--D-glutamate ligase [Aliiglaciecola]|uniref:UDP-N-acetylmuramoyl-L-alanine--D-glutamate ligase n=1 Tax=Aliiglaciecola TaxID=1406885 RepID=UPI001C095440|nr:MULTISPECIES: UDP-N-acetylmuramoyl-L-alanine--D-glutamate ligase [Aliiglaciecola]MBU2876651.1 UDP-N-acetylmuramoyl-L-alanine--D-glutamate ligase [Aliiglaciecola lipolytica]MDO6711414.1 UDP-N-acetylmuramoyl-L-alanine--D-glutamate ligase [Aliiglaciecola sp. 2_MG-2023]MDO6752609.1 UDP-N-acetylmuramoyl-L-alanine--D-glutamate ligase [Aliiglaciecola sp. 1_MG-2023]